MSFFGTQPLNTQVPPAPPFLSDATKSNGISQTATLAPACHLWLEKNFILTYLLFIYSLCPF